MPEYDLTIKKPEDWAKLDEGNLGVIVDPFIYRIGQLFLEGKAVEGKDPASRWAAIEHARK